MTRFGTEKESGGQDNGAADVEKKGLSHQVDENG